MPTRVIVVLAIGTALTAACANKQVRMPQPPRGDVVVLLRDEPSGTLGSASVATSSGTAILELDRQAARLRSGHAPILIDAMSHLDIIEEFGAALSALPLPTRRFTLHFLFNSDELTGESTRLVSTVLDAALKRSVPEITIVGYADTVGSTHENFALGLKRAQAIRTLFIEAGIDPQSVSASSRGENDLWIQTAENSPEPLNRRVELVIR